MVNVGKYTSPMDPMGFGPFFGIGITDETKNPKESIHHQVYSEKQLGMVPLPNGHSSLYLVKLFSRPHTTEFPQNVAKEGKSPYFFQGNLG